MFSPSNLQDLPGEMILNIIDRLPLKDAITLLSISKEMYYFVHDDSVWRKWNAANFEDFVIRVKKLPEILRPNVFATQSLKKAEALELLSKTKDDEFLKKVKLIVSIIPELFPCFSKDILIDNITDPQKLLNVITNNNPFGNAADLDFLQLFIMTWKCIVAVSEQLVSIEQLKKMTTKERVNLLYLFENNDKGLIALRKKLLTAEALAKTTLSELNEIIEKENVSNKNTM